MVHFFFPIFMSFLSSSMKMERKLFLCVSFSNAFSPSLRRGSCETVVSKGESERDSHNAVSFASDRWYHPPLQSPLTLVSVIGGFVAVDAGVYRPHKLVEVLGL